VARSTVTVRRTESSAIPIPCQPTAVSGRPAGSGGGPGYRSPSARRSPAAGGYPWFTSISMDPQVLLAPRLVVTPADEASELNQDPLSEPAGRPAPYRARGYCRAVCSGEDLPGPGCLGQVDRGLAKGGHQAASGHSG